MGASLTPNFFKITPNFLHQYKSKIMWIFCPLLRLFGILSNAKHGDLEHIDSFLSAPFIMFDVECIDDTSLLIDKSQRTRQIIGDSMFSGIQCLREICNIFSVELCDILKNDKNDENIRRRKKIESKLCRRFDQMICLELKLEQFMNLSMNKHFVPSFIPSKSKQKTWLNSPPWKKKKKKKKKKNPKQRAKKKKKKKKKS